MPPASPVVRPAVVEDADAIGRIHVASWQAAYVDTLPADFLRGLSVTGRQDGWRQLLACGDRTQRVLVVSDGTTVAGFGSVGVSRDPDAAPEVGELRSLYLDPPAWGHGLGRALHEAAVDALRRDGHPRATLWVLDGNHRARRFYERAGWEPDGATKLDRVADGPPLDEVRYARTL